MHSVMEYTSQILATYAVCYIIALTVRMVKNGYAQRQVRYLLNRTVRPAKLAHVHVIALINQTQSEEFGEVLVYRDVYICDPDPTESLVHRKGPGAKTRRAMAKMIWGLDNTVTLYRISIDKLPEEYVVVSHLKPTRVDEDFADVELSYSPRADITLVNPKDSIRLVPPRISD
jgi:hypothetical protein